MDKRCIDMTEEEYKEYRRKRNEANRKYFNKPEVKRRRAIYKKIYDLKNKEKISEYCKQHNAKPHVKERQKTWREANKEHLKEYRNRPEYKAKKKESDKKYYMEKRKTKNGLMHWRKKQHEWRETNRDKIKKYNQEYYTSEKGVLNYTKHNHKRLAWIKERDFNLTKKKIKEIYERDKVCVYCGSNENLSLDHIISLKRGGNSLHTNFVVACMSCNASKGEKDVFEWCKLHSIKVPGIIYELLNISTISF